MRRQTVLMPLLAISMCLCACMAHAEDNVVESHIILSNHVFIPQELTVPADKKIKLYVTNKDAAAAEFESDDLRREKVVPANGEIYVYLGPLDKGTYGFFDDFHHSTTTGTLVAN